MTKFFLYFLRWHLSTLVMMPVMYSCSNLPTWLALTVSQTVGCFIFWYVDKFIFTK